MPECMVLEYRAGVHLADRFDLQEGVASVLIRKDNQPVFSPPHVTQVDTTTIQGWFEPMSDDLLDETLPGTPC